MTLDDVVARAAKSEATVLTNLKAFKPLLEVYIQSVRPGDTQIVKASDDLYFLGRFTWRNGPRLETLSAGRDVPRDKKAPGSAKKFRYSPDGFAAMASPDWDLLDGRRYAFLLVKREFIGDARCFVIDVKPLKNPRDGFTGRIWIDDRDFNIVRFNGINPRVERESFGKVLSFHIDSWRTNVLPGLWLPTYVYVEEAQSEAAASKTESRYVSQVRLWGYDPRKTETRHDLADAAAPPQPLSPVQSVRRWEMEAEANVLDRLEKGRLLAAPGEVEKVLETVLNNLAVTNDLTLNRPVRARVLLTSPLESFTVGHTIVLSRGLVDVLPDEASLAMMLAHELAHVTLGHQLIDTKFAFGDRLMVGDDELLELLKVRRTAADEAAADDKVIDMLDKSPYKGKLADAGLFLKIVAASAKQLPNLIQPHLGDHITAGAGIMRLAQVMQLAPELSTDKLDQIAALALGARLVLDPWSSRLELIRNAAQVPHSTREKVPLSISPLMPYVKYMNAPPVFRP